MAAASAAVVERLLVDAAAVVVLERDAGALAWLHNHPAAARLVPVTGDAGDQSVTERA